MAQAEGSLFYFILSSFGGGEHKARIRVVGEPCLEQSSRIITHNNNGVYSNLKIKIRKKKYWGRKTSGLYSFDPRVPYNRHVTQSKQERTRRSPQFRKIKKKKGNTKMRTPGEVCKYMLIATPHKNKRKKRPNLPKLETKKRGYRNGYSNPSSPYSDN